MFLSRYFNMSFILACVIALGVGFLAGFAGSMFVRGSPAALAPEPTAEHISQPESALTLEPTPDMASGPSVQQAADVIAISPTPLASPTPTIKSYIVKEYAGKVAVYKMTSDGQTTLSSLIDIDTASLPGSDQKKLKEGIVLTRQEDMLQLLEDYMS